MNKDMDNNNEQLNNSGGVKPGKYIALNKEGKKFKFSFKDDGAIECNGKKVDFKIEKAEDGFVYALMKNRKYPVEIIGKNQNKYQVLINNVEYGFSIETPISFRRKKFLQKKHKDNKFEQLLAPMPGKIVDILVDEDTQVNAGDPILVLEAMKMQNEITAQSNGRVKKINVKAGDNVMKDDILIEMDK